jgi:hypothetical protein
MIAFPEVKKIMKIAYCNLIGLGQVMFYLKLQSAFANQYIHICIALRPCSYNIHYISHMIYLLLLSIVIQRYLWLC